MESSTVVVHTLHHPTASPALGLTAEGPDAVLLRLLVDFAPGHDSQLMRDVLLGCLQDLSGYPAAALPELAYRLMCQRMSAQPLEWPSVA